MTAPTAAQRAAFASPLLDWFDPDARAMPWRAEDAAGRRDPYYVWLAEVMLQQTRVDQAAPYFERFVAAYPSVATLAAAPLDGVLKRWEGLGYYSRARNLHRAAQRVVAEHGGAVPADPEAFRALPGVGPYTAAAVMSLAFGLPMAVLDGNVIRVLARFFGIADDVAKPRTRRDLQALADALLVPEAPGRFNEAAMELGATVCTPRAPRCPSCPLAPGCAAFALGTPEAFPVKAKKAPVPHYDVAVGIVEDDAGRVLIQRRPDDAMLGGLWEFPGGKREAGEALAETCRREIAEELGVEVAVGEPVARVDHAYSHFRTTVHAYRCRLVAGAPAHHAGEPVRWVTVDELAEYAVPRANRRIIDALAEAARNPSLFSG